MFNIRQWLQRGRQKKKDLQMHRQVDRCSLEQLPAVESLEPRLLMTAVVDIELCVVQAATASDVVDTVPDSIELAKVGETFIAEIWAQDRGPANTQGDRGLAGVQLDLNYHTAALDVQSVTVNPAFNAVSYDIDDPAGLVDDISGYIFDANTGVQPHWVRVATVTFSVQNTGQISLQVNPGTAQIARWGAGNVPWDDVDLDILNLTCYSTIPIEPNGDFSGDGKVDADDLDIIDRNWGMQSGATKAHGDADGDHLVGLLDLDILGQTWGYGTAAAFSLADYSPLLHDLCVMDDSSQPGLSVQFPHTNNLSVCTEEIESDLIRLLLFEE